MSNTALVLKMYEYFNTGDLDAIRTELFAPDIVWRMPGHHPLSGAHTGADAVISFFAALAGAGITVDDVHFGELENGTVIERHLGHGSVDGVHYTFPTATAYDVVDGRMVSVQVHTADQHSVDRFFWTVFGLKPVPERLAA
ncbi:MAG: nuclear transport factor 2 family protein [Kineosporiaceae bacterium]